jgi:RimJ/RimL family protein N-acetyltransferase
MTSATIAPVISEDAVLRMLDAADLRLTREWRNHAESRDAFHSTSLISPDGHLAWYDAYLHRDDDFVFIMEVGGRPVAQAAIYDVAARAGEFGRLLVDPAARGTGLSHRVIGLCLRVADETLQLDDLHLEVKPGNARAIRAYERAGFATDHGAVGQHGSMVMRRHRP